MWVIGKGIEWQGRNSARPWQTSLLARVTPEADAGRRIPLLRWLSVSMLAWLPPHKLILHSILGIVTPIPVPRRRYRPRPRASYSRTGIACTPTQASAAAPQMKGLGTAPRSPPELASIGCLVVPVLNKLLQLPASASHGYDLFASGAARTVL